MWPNSLKFSLEGKREVDPSGGSGQRQACFCSVLRLGRDLSMFQG